MIWWTVRAFGPSADKTVVSEWGAPAKAQAKLDQRLNFMKDRPTHDWPYDYAHKLTDADGLWEIKFESGGIAYRPLFFLGPTRQELTIVYMAEERGDRWRPPTALAIAIENMKVAKSDHTLTHVYDDYL